MKLYTRLALGGAALLAALAACEDNPFVVGNYGVDGRWTGSALAGADPDTVRFYFDLSLDQNRGSLSGDGEIRAGTDTIPVDVDGTWTAGNGSVTVRLTMGSSSVAPLSFSGGFDVDTVARVAPDTGRVVQLDRDTLVGTLTGSGMPTTPPVKLWLGRTAED
jgi:hypothetical protein